MIWLSVAVGGAAGAMLRYSLTQWLSASTFPWATAVANVSGSFCIGVLFVAVTQRWGQDHPAHALLIVGLLGGFTTFSAFSLDCLRLLEAGRVMAASAYVLGSVLLALLAAAGGLQLARRLLQL